MSDGGGDRVSLGGCDCADTVAQSREQFRKRGADQGVILDGEHTERFHRFRCARPRPERNRYPRKPAGNPERPRESRSSEETERGERRQAGAVLVGDNREAEMADLKEVEALFLALVCGSTGAEGVLLN